MNARIAGVLGLFAAVAVVACSAEGDSDPDSTDETAQAVTPTADGGAGQTPTTTTPTAADAGPASARFEGTKVVAGGAINPPDPVAACMAAKNDARAKAARAGFTGRVVWDHLSRDSDCQLSTTRVGSLGYYYIFTAKGTFYR